MYDPLVAGSAYGVRLFVCELDVALPLINAPRAEFQQCNYNPTAQVTGIDLFELSAKGRAQSRCAVVNICSRILTSENCKMMCLSAIILKIDGV